MATLTDSEVEKLFSGAPQYFARSEGHYTGAPHPSVAFPWDEELEIRDLTDHTQIEDKAWGSITAWPHITRDVNSDRSAAQRASEAKRRAHFYPRCRERPNMLSMFGLEKGSMGYQAALELGVADALQEEQWGFESLGARDPVIVKQRQAMFASRDGLRHVDESLIMEQLIKNGQRYCEPHPREPRLSGDLYNELFTQILHPPTKVLDHRDPYSLSAQIMALVRVLAMPNVWIDFSHVEWRIRLGQLLWEDPRRDDAGNEASVQAGDSASDIHEERYWLLLQVLLACELLVRLDAITEGEELGAGSIRPAEIYKFEKEATKSVKWSLILARVWLENIEVVKSEANAPADVEEKSSGWLATLTKRMSLTRDHESQNHHSRDPAYAIKGKHARRQVNGLAHFARRLRWPGENDPEALSSLGPTANLCSGFVYSGKSFWSTSCIVGRVLSAGRGAVECMGWISSDVIPRGFGNGWVKIDAKETPEDAHQVAKKPAFGNTYPEKEPPAFDVVLKALNLGPPDSPDQSNPGNDREAATVPDDGRVNSPPVCAASVTFAVTDLDSEEVHEYTYSLAKDINFVTAHPTASVVGHPLHKYYTYVALHLSELLTKKDCTLESLLSSYSSSPRQRPVTSPQLLQQSSPVAKVLVIDCITGFQPQPQEHEIPLSPVVSRTDSNNSAEMVASPTSSSVSLRSGADNGQGSGTGTATLESASKKMHSESRRRQFGSDMEILVRALCAEKGWNALISRRRRGCLACAIREAGALGWKVVIRVD
ncbi:hypothetical protein VTH06DRAFT_8474 [Thermothelomyces fergusii]